ncbi:MAG: asparagine synthase (glutamine-hydrolyzing) [Saprospiraceae bacterium]
MCGITAIFNKSGIRTDTLGKANALAAHRGPDDEGFLLWRPDATWRMYAGNDSSAASRAHHQLALLPNDDTTWQVGLGHRRLSILDLSPQGHQPMTLDGRFAITYNGEVYNYLEIRQELQALGHAFHTGSDTEVMLHAWLEWGPEALDRFNGMFAFVLLDTHMQKLYAVRDRFGVKPLYYTDQPGYLAFASEVKQLRILPEYQFVLDEYTAYDFLRYSSLDHNTSTFELGIYQLPQGHLFELNFRSGEHRLQPWYRLQPVPFIGNDQEAFEQFRHLLKDSVRLRLRSDVPVGSALSGGLDSSTIVCLMREILDEQGDSEKILETVTSCSTDKRYDETEFAQTIIDHTHSRGHKVFPELEQLTHDLQRMIWHLDYPFGSTSPFSQWCVFEGAARAGLTVMVDGQGADEQLAGYGGNDMALYIGLLSGGELAQLMSEVRAYRQYRGHWPLGFVLGAVQYHLPEGLMNRLPERYRIFKQHPPFWMRQGNGSPAPKWPGSLQQSLCRQVTERPLPSLLRYEDRNSMAFSIESRVPFMDYRLIEFTLGLPERLVYRQGERKYILRQAFQGVVPDNILQRRDKMGFVSAEERWLREDGKTWFGAMFDAAADSLNDLVQPERLAPMLRRMQAGEIPFNFDPWRIICLSQWLKQTQQGWTPTS